MSQLLGYKRGPSGDADVEGNGFDKSSVLYTLLKDVVGQNDFLNFPPLPYGDDFEQRVAEMRRQRGMRSRKDTTDMLMRETAEFDYNVQKLISTLDPVYVPALERVLIGARKIRSLQAFLSGRASGPLAQRKRLVVDPEKDDLFPKVDESQYILNDVFAIDGIQMVAPERGTFKVKMTFAIPRNIEDPSCKPFVRLQLTTPKPSMFTFQFWADELKYLLVLPKDRIIAKATDPHLEVDDVFLVLILERQNVRNPKMKQYQALVFKGNAADTKYPVQFLQQNAGGEVQTTNVAAPGFITMLHNTLRAYFTASKRTNLIPTLHSCENGSIYRTCALQAHRRGKCGHFFIVHGVGLLFVKGKNDTAFVHNSQITSISQSRMKISLNRAFDIHVGVVQELAHSWGAVKPVANFEMIEKTEHAKMLYNALVHAWKQGDQLNMESLTKVMAAPPKVEFVPDSKSRSGRKLRRSAHDAKQAVASMAHVPATLQPGHDEEEGDEEAMAAHPGYDEEDGDWKPAAHHEAMLSEDGDDGSFDEAGEDESYEDGEQKYEPPQYDPVVAGQSPLGALPYQPTL